MAIDRTKFDSLETGAKNQILSAMSTGGTTAAEAKYNELVGATPAPTDTTTNNAVDLSKEVFGGATTPAPTEPAPTTPVPTSNTTPAPTPTATTPVKTETPTAVKTEAVKTHEQIKARQEQIVTNLNTAYNEAGNTVKQLIDNGDYEAYKKIYSSTDPNEAKVVDAYFQAKQPKTDDAYYNLISTGQVIYNDTIKNDPNFKLAQQRFNDFKTYSSYSSNQLASILKSGQLLPNTKLYNSLKADPNTSAKLAQAEAINKASGSSIDLTKAGEAQTESILNSNLTTANALADGQITGDEYKAMLQTPEISAKQKEVETLKTKYDTLKADYDNVELAVEEEIKGKPVSSSQKAALIADRRKGMYRDLQVATDTYNNALGTLSDLQKTQASIVDMNLNLYNKAEERKYQESLMNREFDLKYGDINSTDPRIQKVGFERMATQIQEQYKGMPFRRDIPTMASDFQTQYNSLIAQGKTPSEALEAVTKDVTNAIQNAPTYTQWATSKGLIKDATETEMKNIELEIARTNLQKLKNGEASFTTIGYDENGKPISGFVNNVTQEITPASGVVSGGSSLMQVLASGNINGEKFFGVYATGDPTGINRKNLYDTISKMSLDEAINKYGNGKSKITSEMIINSSIKTGIDPYMIATIMAADSSMGTAGKGARNNNPGNVGQFDSLDAKGITVKGYNTLQEGVDAVAMNLKKRYDALLTTKNGQKLYSQQPSTTAQPTGGYDPNITEQYKKILDLGHKTPPKNFVDTLRKETGKDWVTLSQEATAYGKELDKEGLPEVDKLISDLSTLKKLGADYTTRILAKGGEYSSLVNPDAADLSATYNSIISKTSLQNLIDLKNRGATFGSLSNQELSFIKDASDTGKLKLGTSDKMWNSTIDSLLENAKKIKNKMSGGTVKTENKINNIPMTMDSWNSFIDNYNR